MWELTSVIQRFVSLFAAFALRLFWTEKRLAARIKITVSSEHEGIRIDAGELPNFHGWIEIINLSPFPIEIDRLYGELFYGARIASFTWLDRATVSPSSEQKVRIGCDLTDAQARYLRRTYGRNKTRLSVNGHFVCRVRGFRVSGRSIESSNVEVINADMP